MAGPLALHHMTSALAIMVLLSSASMAGLATKVT
jgi:hypothetical protein